MSRARSLSQETIEDIDKNGDGFIDLQEYIGKEYCTHIYSTTPISKFSSSFLKIHF